jgi:hypothetical protein
MKIAGFVFAEGTAEVNNVKPASAKIAPLLCPKNGVITKGGLPVRISLLKPNNLSIAKVDSW